MRTLLALALTAFAVACATPAPPPAAVAATPMVRPDPFPAYQGPVEPADVVKQPR